RFDEAILEDGGPSVTGSPDRVGPPLRTRQPAAVASRRLALPERQTTTPRAGEAGTVARRATHRKPGAPLRDLKNPHQRRRSPSDPVTQRRRRAPSGPLRRQARHEAEDEIRLASTTTAAPIIAAVIAGVARRRETRPWPEFFQS